MAYIKRGSCFLAVVALVGACLWAHYCHNKRAFIEDFQVLTAGQVEVEAVLYQNGKRIVLENIPDKAALLQKIQGTIVYSGRFPSNDPISSTANVYELAIYSEGKDTGFFSKLMVSNTDKTLNCFWGYNGKYAIQGGSELANYLDDYVSKRFA